ncbi:hypothetical protein D3C71_1981080 [compost metagenome]
MAARLLIQRRAITGQRLLVRIELDDHATLWSRPPLQRLAAPATGQEAATIGLERRRRTLGVLLVLLGVGHVDVGDPIGLHPRCSCLNDICV